MSIKEKLFGPKSKYDSTIPYTYVARVRIIEGDDAHIDYFADTICGLIDHLDDKDINPEEVRIFGLYRDHEIELDVKFCVAEGGGWLERPGICHSLEQRYHETLETQYKGHVEEGECSYEDREREGSGPF
ncbi:MAG: hypothetical protein C0600_08795 [Ignavibacteria bacterium]|nr:MAG: hypothetical protein C0600_08795 [Ignavibacteria bacterium]